MTVQEVQETWAQSLGQEDPREEEMERTPVFLPEESHGQRSLAGYNPQVCKLDMTEVTRAIDGKRFFLLLTNTSDSKCMFFPHINQSSKSLNTK